MVNASDPANINYSYGDFYSCEIFLSKFFLHLMFTAEVTVLPGFNTERQHFDLLYPLGPCIGKGITVRYA